MAKVQSGGQKVPKAGEKTHNNQYPTGYPPMGAPPLQKVMRGGTVKK